MPVDPEETCWIVLRSAAGGDTDARSAFSRRYQSVICGFFEARWCGRWLSTETDDATQEVFIECLKPGGVLERADRGRGDFRGLLYGVMRNVARRFEERALARGRLQPDDSAWLQGIASDDAGQATVFDRIWAQSLMLEAKRLHRQRAQAEGEDGLRRLELLERRFGDDEAIRDIATRWDVPSQDVHNAYRKARTEFYRCLREIVAFHAPGAADLDAECRRLLAALD